jgi:DNA-binding XRE family transcriptional regulator
MIYFIKDGVSDCIKIGYSAKNNIRQRISCLRCGNPNPLEVLKIIPGSMGLEKEIHHKFKHLKKSGEWYAISDELLDFIENPVVKTATEDSHQSDCTSNNIEKAISFTIKEFRESISKTQNTCAKELGIAKNYFSDLERGVVKPSPSLAIAIEAWSGGAITRAELRPDLWG